MKHHDRLNILSRALLVISGLLCVLRAPYIYQWFPYLIGCLMIFAGGAMCRDAYPAVRGREADFERYGSRLTRGTLLMMLGLATVLKREDSMPFIGVVWGLLGLIKGGRGITAFIACPERNRHAVALLAKALIGIALSFLLLFNPVDAVGKHITLLGLQIIVFAVLKMGSDSQPREMVQEIHEHVDELAQVSRSRK